MKKIILLVILIISLSISGCHKCHLYNLVDGTIVRKSVDGCTWLIQLDNNSLLEPTNLNNFKVTVSDGQKVRLSYSENKNQMSICMMGTIVDLDYIADR